MELNMFPHTRFFLFEAKKKGDKPADEKGEADSENSGEGTAEEIPF